MSTKTPFQSEDPADACSVRPLPLPATVSFHQGLNGLPENGHWLFLELTAKRTVAKYEFYNVEEPGEHNAQLITGNRGGRHNTCWEFQA